MAVITNKEPEHTSNLRAYMVSIAKASTKYSWPLWVVYDQNFYQEAADIGLRDWAKPPRLILASTHSVSQMQP